MRAEDLNPTDAHRKYGPEIADLIRRHQALRCRHEQVCACVDDLLDITERGPKAVALVTELNELLRTPVPK